MLLHKGDPDGMFQKANDQRHWTTFPDNDHPSQSPNLTSAACYNALVDFFEYQSSSFNLQLATESSSHLAGLDSLMAQPWVYAGGGLGNIAECPLQVCLAGGTKRDSLTFASVCVVPECEASDLAATDFVERLTSAASKEVHRRPNQDIIEEYITLHKRIAEVNKFLGTGWVCGYKEFDWQVVPSVLYFAFLVLCILCTLCGTFCAPTRKQRRVSHSYSGSIPRYAEEKKAEVEMESQNQQLDEGNNHVRSSSRWSHHFWDAWDAKRHISKLFLHRPETACLDGLKVTSTLWVIAGHAMAIQCSAGPGYINPSSFLPPVGVTTTLFGQLLFSSRFAIDTFLCISGFLVVHVLKGKLQPKMLSIGLVIFFRILRLLPMYLVCLFFWTSVAPHTGSGPFWYQWEDFLRPCRQYWWTNLLFLNNFLPWGAPTTDTCFYHSWYLAVDIQLFVFLAPWLVLLSRQSATYAFRLTVLLWLVSLITTTALTYERGWSVNTFDGIDIAIFDREGYTKPHVRAQAYLSGMVVAMLPHGPHRPWGDAILTCIAVISLLLLAFVTVTGAYARRPCNFQESPTLNGCGSTWPSAVTFLYSALGRAVWSAAIGTIVYLSIQKRSFGIGKVLSWRLWTPLANISFGAYLIHPILILIWQLNGREKVTFQWMSFLMDLTAVVVVSFSIAAMASITIEFPLHDLFRLLFHRPTNHANDVFKQSELMPLNQHSFTYGLSNPSFFSSDKHRGDFSHDSRDDQ